MFKFCASFWWAEILVLQIITDLVNYLPLNFVGVAHWYRTSKLAYLFLCIPLFCSLSIMLSPINSLDKAPRLPNIFIYINGMRRYACAYYVV